VVLRGIAGCGKSTFASSLAASIQDASAVVSTDDIRTEPSGEADSEPNAGKVFWVRDQRVQIRLRAGLPTIADAMHLTPRDCMGLIEAARNAGAAVSLVDCGVSTDVARQRNSRRDRIVDDDTITRQAARYDAHDLSDFAPMFDVVCNATDVAGWVPPGVHGEHLHGPFDIIGDVHGHAEPLETVAEKLGYADDWSHPQGRTLVFVGDLVDKGPEPLRVLHRVMDAHRRGRALVVRGNHEHKLAKILSGIDAAARTAEERLEALTKQAEPGTHGRQTTVADLMVSEYVETGFSELTRWLTRLPTHMVLDGGNLVVVHASIRSDIVGVTEFPSEASRRRAEGRCLYGPPAKHFEDGRPVGCADWVSEWDGSATVVRGHVTVDEPEITNGVVSVDAGAGSGGSLAAYSYPESTFVTAPVE
jgi:predicted kinase